MNLNTQNVYKNELLNNSIDANEILTSCLKKTSNSTMKRFDWLSHLRKMCYCITETADTIPCGKKYFIFKERKFWFIMDLYSQ